MDALLSAVASDLVGRFISFIVEKYQNQAAANKLAWLQRLLLRARTVVEEAEARQIANQGMLLQLLQLREAMYRGHYVLDTFKIRTAQSKGRDHQVSESFNLSKLQNDSENLEATLGEGRHITNRGMLLQLQELREAMYRGYYMLHAHTCKKETIDQISENTHAAVSQSFHLDSLQRILHSLESTIGDMKEFAVLLMDCPRIVRQPYSTYLFMERCMFGRHAEKEKIMDFLLQPCSFLAVLPIIGPCEVGKRTLVEHVCIDEKVRKHFCQVQHLTGDNLDSDQPFRYSSGRSLIVIEFLLHVSEEAWRRFYSSICQTNRN